MASKAGEAGPSFAFCCWRLWASISPPTPLSVGLDGCSCPPGCELSEVVGKGSCRLTFPECAAQAVGCGRDPPGPSRSSWDPPPLSFGPLQPQEGVDQAPSRGRLEAEGPQARYVSGLQEGERRATGREMGFLFPSRAAAASGQGGSVSQAGPGLSPDVLSLHQGVRPAQ